MSQQQLPEHVRTPTIDEILERWDGVDLVEGVRLLAQHYPCHSLAESLRLTALVEEYHKHHKQHVKASD